MASTKSVSQPPSVPGRQVVILINVTVNQFGVNYFSYFLFDGQPAADPVVVRVGDHVAWYVQITSGTVPQTPPYELTFSDPTMFGVSSLSVPRGGGSTYLQVLPQVDFITMKYTVQVEGVRPAFDPEMQTDPSGPLMGKNRKDGKHEKAILPSTYSILWQPDSGNPMTLTCTKNGNPQNFPLTVYPGDLFTFTALGAMVPPQFSVYFSSDGTSWASPFSLTQSKFPSTATNGNYSSTAQLTVGSVAKLPHDFTFLAVLNDLSRHSDSQKVTVATPPNKNLPEETEKEEGAEE